VKRIRADFVKANAPTWWAWAICTALIVACISAGVAVAHGWHEAQLRAQALQAAVEMRTATPSTPMAPPSRAYQVNAQELLRMRSFPWGESLTMFESTAVVGVTTTQIEFTAGEEIVRAEVSFNDYSGVLDYLNALNVAGPAVRWSLSQTQTSSTGTSGGTAHLLGRVVPR
jgi:hypothetical protein